MAKFSVLQGIPNTLKSWANLLRSLTFSENFRGYEWQGSFLAGETVKITHDLKVIPNRFIVVDSRESGAPVTRPALPKATADFFYITSVSDFDGRVLILP